MCETFERFSNTVPLGNYETQKSNKYYADIEETFVLLVDGPSVVKLMLKRRHLSAGKSHQIKCEAIGAKPQATISWWVGGKQVRIISFSQMKA